MFHMQNCLTYLDEIWYWRSTLEVVWELHSGLCWSDIIPTLDLFEFQSKLYWPRKNSPLYTKFCIKYYLNKYNFYFKHVWMQWNIIKINFTSCVVNNCTTVDLLLEPNGMNCWHSLVSTGTHCKNFMSLNCYMQETWVWSAYIRLKENQNNAPRCSLHKFSIIS